VNPLRIVGDLDASHGWSEGRLFDASRCRPGAPVPNDLRGSFSCVNASPDGRYRIVRDPVGINKLFWSEADGGELLVAARPKRLVDAGCRFESIHAVPAGAVVDLDLSASCGATSSLTGEIALQGEERQSIDALAGDIQSTLDRYCDALATAHAQTRVFVCLSAGLDSSGIAVLAREHFRDVIAVSFDLHRQGNVRSDDRVTAERLARDLGLPLACVTVTDDELLAAMDMVLVEGIDWRDFNVHAALVNAALAKGIAAIADGPALVLTGDFPNELLVDYHSEAYRGREYYRLPRLAPAALRATLVKGLETSHREGGPFQACGLPVVQPYAVVIDQYLSLPPAFLHLDDRKERLSRMIFGDRIPSYVYARPKTRAQVGGDAVGGVLATCIDHGIDAAWLRRRFAKLHGVTDVTLLDRFIRAGRYRAAIPSTTKVLS
jgi:asparagine synthetase B (glutamine-hydrolysing)